MTTDNSKLPEWLTNANSVTKSVSNGKPSTEAGTALLNRFSETSDPNTGAVIRFTREEAAEACKRQYTLSQTSIAMITGDNLDKCFPTANYRPKAPTIPVMIDAFGKDMVSEWLFDNIELLIEFAGGNIKMDSFQIDMLSLVLTEKFSEGRNILNAREIMLFFLKVIKGDFGKFYGAIDPIAIGDMASKFLEWRSKQLDRVSKDEEERLRKQRIEEMNANAAPMPEEAKKLLLALYSSFPSSRNN